MKINNIPWYTMSKSTENFNTYISLLVHLVKHKKIIICIYRSYILFLIISKETALQDTKQMPIMKI